MEAPVYIEPYDPAWADAFVRERTMLADVLRPWLVGPIEHIGSTAIPGLAAKPVIDIMAGVASLDASRPAIEALRGVGYCHAPYREDVMHWFCKPRPELRTHHLHLVPFGSALWLERLAFRDALAANADLAGEYAEVKRRLAEIHRFDRERYTQDKSAFIGRVLHREPPRIIDTQRLRLRPPRPSDVDAIFEYASDPEVTRYMDWKSLSRPAEAEVFRARTARSWERGDEFTWIITKPGDDRAIGGISLGARDEDADFGYVLNRREWGRGYGTEAARAIVDWACGKRAVPRIWATCDVENVRSIRVIEKAGLKREGLVPGGMIRPNISAEPRAAFIFAK